MQSRALILTRAVFMYAKSYRVHNHLRIGRYNFFFDTSSLCILWIYARSYNLRTAHIQQNREYGNVVHLTWHFSTNILVSYISKSDTKWGRSIRNVCVRGKRLHMGMYIFWLHRCAYEENVLLLLLIFDNILL